MERSLKIDLKIGGYFLGSQSATGKTYLGTLMKAANTVCSEEKNYLVISYETSDISYIRAVIAKFKGKYILFDRLDTYISDELIALINSLVKEYVVLLDLKDYVIANKIAARPVKLCLTKEGVEVREYKTYV